VDTKKFAILFVLSLRPVTLPQTPKIWDRSPGATDKMVPFAEKPRPGDIGVKLNRGRDRALWALGENRLFRIAKSSTEDSKFESGVCKINNFNLNYLIS
jgi:hypothetical protein